MTILREAMTRYSHTGKPVEGNETRVRWEGGKSQLQYNPGVGTAIYGLYGYVLL